MQEYERVIDFKQFVIDELRQWRKLLVFMVIGAILGAGYGYYGVLHPKTELVMTQEEIVAAESTIAQNESTIASYQAELPNQQANLATYEENKKNYETLLEQTSSVEVIDSALIAEIAEINQNIAGLNSQINTAQQRIQTLESEIPRLKESNQALQKQMQETVELQDNKVILYIVVGLVLCAFLYFAWRFILLMLDDKIQSEGEIAECYHIPVLGSFYQKYTKQQMEKHRGLDVLLDRFEKYCDDEEKVCQKIARKLELYAKNDSSILITGTVNIQELQKICGQLEKYVNLDKLKLKVGGNPLVVSNTFIEMKDKSVVLVERVGESKYKDIQEIMIAIKESNTRIIGGIIL